MNQTLPLAWCVVLSGVGLALCRAEDDRQPATRPATTRPETRQANQRAEGLRDKQRQRPAAAKKATAKQKREKSAAKYQVFRLQKEVKKRLVCATCNGVGRKSVHVPDADGGRILRPETIPCPACAGSGIAPASGVHDIVSKYYRARFDYEARYPEDGPLAKDLEAWIVQAVRTDDAVMRLNADAADRLASDRGRPGDVYVIGVESFAVEPMAVAPGDAAAPPAAGPADVPGAMAGAVVHAVLHPKVGAGPRERVNLSVVFDGGIPPDLRAPCGVLLIAVDRGKDFYRGVFGNPVQTRVLTALRARRMTAERLPWEPALTGELRQVGDE